MKINFNTPLIDVRDNTELTYEKKKGDLTSEATLTLGIAAAEGLGAMFDDERTLASTERLKRGLLIEQIFKRPESEISIEEANLIRERIGKLYGPLVVVAAEKVLDPKSE
jgi:hypothetical protein